YTPVMALSVIGMYYLRHTVRELFIVLPVLFILLIYITFSWWCWWYGGSMGQRPLVDWYGILALPVAAVLYKLQSRRRVWNMTFVILLLLTVFNQFQHVQYRYQ